MRFVRFKHQGIESYGRLEGEQISVLAAAPWEKDAAPAGSPRLPLSAVELLVPVLASKVVAVGQNYRKHAEEMGKPLPVEPLLFLKPPSALNAHGQPIVLPKQSELIHYEAELALIIGRRTHHADEKTALDSVFGLSCFNDVTARDLQRKDVQFTRGKGFDTFACLGPWVETERSPEDLRIQCRVNGQTRQDGRSSDMVFNAAQLVSFISSVMTLMPGDVLATGTPAGVGPLVAGDNVEIEIEGIGVLRNPVQAG